MTAEHVQIIQVTYRHTFPGAEKWHAWFESGEEALRFERAKQAAGYLTEAFTCAVTVKS